MNINDAFVREVYRTTIRRHAYQVQKSVVRSETTWEQAARQASHLRNAAMERLRKFTSPVGQTFAEFSKTEGIGFDTLINRYTKKRFGAECVFEALKPAEQNAVYQDIFKAASRSNAGVNTLFKKNNVLALMTVVAAVVFKVHAIAEARDKGEAAKREAAITGSAVTVGYAAGFIARHALRMRKASTMMQVVAIAGMITSLLIERVWARPSS